MACAKCGGATVEGYIPDAGHAGRMALPRWFTGVPAKSFWYGLKIDQSQGLPITAQRCSRCGFLELYARPA